LARGRTSDALAAIRRLLAESRDPVHRSQLLPAAVEILVAAGETDDALAVSEELSGVANAFACPALKAMAQYATGNVLLATGQASEAVPELRKAQQLWQQLSAPYETARARLQIGRALRELGDEQSASSELAAARQTFAELGATSAESEAALAMAPTLPRGLTPRELEVLRLVATGKSNPQIAEILVLSEKTVARHLSNIFAKLDVSTRTAAAAFAFEQRLL
jgi:DNA-binding NarL/FixJ family response regulator